MAITRFNLAALTDVLEKAATILVPNHRIKDAILNSHAQQFSQSIFKTPSVHAIDIWLQELCRKSASLGIEPFCDQRLLNASEEMIIWLGIIEKSLDQIPLLNPEETALAVSRSYRDMKQWFIDETIQQELKAATGIVDVRIYLGWVKQFEDYCQEKKLVTLARCIEQITHCLQQGTDLPLPDETALVNFYQSPPLYQLLFQHLPGLSRINTANDTGIEESGENSPLKIRMEFSDLQSEIHACAHWAKTLIDKEPTAHIGIIYSGESQRRSELERIFADILDKNSLLEFNENYSCFNHAGCQQQLTQQAIINDAFLLLNLANEVQDSNEICRLLQSPYILNTDENWNEGGNKESKEHKEHNETEARIQLELHMRRDFSADCFMSELTRLIQQTDKPWHCPALANGLLQYRERLRGMKTASASQWRDCFKDLLTILGWPGSSMKSSGGSSRSKIEHTALKQWQEALQVFAACDGILGQLTHSAAVSRLRSLCAHINVHQSFDARRQLSLYSIDEASGLQFDHVWLVGFDDQAWPPPGNPSPFLPYSLQQQAGIPSASSESRFRQALDGFNILCNSVRQSIYASHHCAEGDQEFRACGFSKNFELISDDKAKQDISKLNKYAHDLLGTISIKEVLDDDIPALTPEENVRGGMGLISNQSSCPFRAFTRNRLEASPLDEFSSGLTSMARGTAIHIALETFFKDLDSRQKILDQDEQSLAEHCARAAEEAASYLSGKYPQLMTPRFRNIEKQRLQKLLKVFAQQEMSREDFRVEGREQSVRWQYGPLTLNLKIDRIDRLADDSLAVLDYKSGKFTASRQSLLEERPEDMQLPLYYTVISDQQEQELSVVGIAHINAEKIGYSGFAAQANFHPQLKPISTDDKFEWSWNELGALWQSKIELFADEFVKGKANIAPSHPWDSCTYCGLQSLCRVQELADSLTMSPDLEDDDDYI